MFIWNQFHFASFFQIIVSFCCTFHQNGSKLTKVSTASNDEYIVILFGIFAWVFLSLFLYVVFNILYLSKHQSPLYVKIDPNWAQQYVAVSKIGWISCFILKFCIFSHKNILKLRKVKSAKLDLFLSCFRLSVFCIHRNSSILRTAELATALFINVRHKRSKSSNGALPFGRGRCIIGSFWTNSKCVGEI